MASGGGVEIRGFLREDSEQVVSLWERCGLTRPWNDPRRDIERRLKVQSELFLVGDIDGRVVGSAMAGFDGHRGWVNYLAVDPDLRRRGPGPAPRAPATAGLKRLGCPKVNVQIRRDNAAAMEFYRRLGFGEDDVVSMGKRLEPDG
jgi:ribosomal protein S18 acetylase RimI-like enzyme